jgi:hypothetical protein
MDLQLAADAGGDVAATVLALLCGGYIGPCRIDLPSHSMTINRRDVRR